MFQIKLAKDASELQTNRKIILLSGGLYDGTWSSIFLVALRTVPMSIAVSQFLIKIFFWVEEESPLVIIEALHWLLIFSTVDVMVINCIVQSSRFLKMEATIKSGFFDYGGELNKEQIMTRVEADRVIQLSTWAFSAACTFMLLANFFKAPLFMDGWSLPYPMWMPFEINSWFRYFVAMGWIWLSSESMVFSGVGNWIIYVTFANHLIAQFKILILAIKKMDTYMDVSVGKREIMMSAQIKNCVKHHLILIKFFVEFQTYFDASLVAIAVNIGLILCAVGYVIMSPDSPVALVAPLLLVIIPELCYVGIYCLLGQWITDVATSIEMFTKYWKLTDYQAEEVGLAIYNIEWYTMPLTVQRDLLMMLIGCKKARQLTAMGLHEFSIKGYSELVKAAFTYFNMLNVLSRK